MDQTLRRQIEHILTATADMTIATVRPDGWPQATTVSFVSDGLTIWFAAAAASQKAANIAANPKVSLTVNRPYTEWSAIEGLSLAGLAARVDDGEQIARVGRMLLAKFPQAANYSLPEDEIACIRVQPKAICVLDYSKGFGHTVLVEP